MYIPHQFQMKNIEEVKQFIQTHSFATVIATKNNRPIAVHVPVALRQLDGHDVLTGHVAYGNPIWRAIERNEEVLVIFQGAHAYVSSSWYQDENVPTWNYEAVHVYGKGRCLTKEETLIEMKHQLTVYEQQQKNPVTWESLSDELLTTELKGIQAFAITMDSIQAASKMSQNRNDTDYQSIIHHLQENEDPMTQQVAEVMKTLKNKGEK